MNENVFRPPSTIKFLEFKLMATLAQGWGERYGYHSNLYTIRIPYYISYEEYK